MKTAVSNRVKEIVGNVVFDVYYTLRRILQIRKQAMLLCS